MSLHEFLYIDQRRLRGYCEQIRSAPHTRTVPTFSASMSLAGPSLSLGTSQAESDPSDDERYRILCDYLQAQELMAETRPTQADTWDRADPVSGLAYEVDYELRRPFRLEVCEVFPIVIPPRPDVPHVLEHGLHLWGSTAEIGGPPQPLILIEEFPLSDSGAAKLAFCSGLTGLHMIRMSLEPEFDAWQFGKDELPDEWRSLEMLSLLRGVGGKTGPSRTVRVLYRIRVTYYETDGSLSTIGYPIVMERA